MTEDEGTRKAIERIEKLMRLSASNPNEAEAASALAKAQELLAAYNLDMATIEMNSGATSGKRLDENVSGGMYRYQRELWRNIAELNWCMYWTMKVRTKEGSIQLVRFKRRWTHEHRLVGRQVNVIATRNMAGYLNSAIERLCIERLKGDNEGKQFLSSWAVAFREGIADRVIEKVAARRRSILEDEERRAAETARKASKEGVSLSTALTLASIEEREEAANYDFLHGEGAWAKKIARQAEWEKGWAERRAAQAKADAEAERVYAEWATAHPEEAAKEEAERLKKERAAQKRRDNYRPRYRFRATKEEMRKDSGGYHAGYEVGAKVGIDPQVDEDKRRIGRG